MFRSVRGSGRRPRSGFRRRWFQGRDLQPAGEYKLLVVVVIVLLVVVVVVVVDDGCVGDQRAFVITTRFRLTESNAHNLVFLPGRKL